MKYLGNDGVERDFDGHIAYLERCAAAWEKGLYGKPAPEEAARVRALRDRLIIEAADGAIDEREWHRRHPEE